MNFMVCKLYLSFLERNKNEEAEWAPFLSLLLLNFLLWLPLDVPGAPDGVQILAFWPC